MNQSFRSTPVQESASRDTGHRLKTFDYTPLNAQVAQRVQTAAQRIRRMVQQTLQNLLAVGQELLAVKKTLPHGHFGPWLRAEFGWTERTARNFMAVAERFGAKTEMISDLRIDPTAAYLLAAPSTPEEASAAAVRRAENGERITLAVAREILHQVRKKPVHHASRQPEMPASKLWGQLLESLESFRQRWNPRQVSLLAQQLREFADSLEEESI